MYGSIIATGLLPALEGPYFARLLRFFPPVVTGTLLTIMGTTLLGVSTGDASFTEAATAAGRGCSTGGVPFADAPVA